MSTRSKTRAALASTSEVSPAEPPQTQSTANIRSRKPSQTTAIPVDHPEQENKGVKASQPLSKPKPTKSKKSKASLKAVYCLCAKGDDGTPMVHCSECKEWYHFSCVKLSEIDADDISIYICISCTETTGRQTVMSWEGPEALEECAPDAQPGVKTASKEPTPRLQLKPPPAPISESEDDPSSADEYVADDAQPKGKGVSATKRRVRRLSYRSESESSDDHGNKVSRRRVRASPGLSTQLKRKTSHASQLPPPSKRKKSSDVKVTDDPARKYCLSKLEEVFRDIFLRYPHVRGKQETVEGGGGDGENIIQKPLQELTDEDKGALLEEAKQFAMDLEQCVYDIYSEPDKQGMPSAGGKYKDRFRMLQFNLSKIDRIVIHQRIASANITPKEISLMSSTDLANEETKESIKIAEKEALEHSILQKATAPRAKLTHKGLQDIEDVNGVVVGLLGPDREREQEEEEKRERERVARLRTVHSQQRQRTASVSVPPESPIGQQNTAWGGPPPVPMHANPPGSEVASSPGSERLPLYLHGSSDFTNMEPELNLADLINIDDEPGGHENNTPASPSPLDTAARASKPGDNPTSQLLSPSLPLAPPTGISPFAAQPNTPQATSFDLDSLWKAPKPESAPPTSGSSPTPSEPTIPPATGSNQKDVIMETEVIEEADDRDFDMLLEEKEQDTPMAVAVSQSNFEALPQVWTGKLGMPLDSTTPQETSVIARQMGGRSITHDSPVWKTLFPTNLLKIEGRVPVKDSAKFLLQVRMNPTKELIGVAFSSEAESNNVGFTLLTDFLIAKGRHGLVFPWGPRPKEHYPGREFYIIPLLSSDPLPDYMELLDELKLPKIRTSNYLVGIWVLNKGKLAPPPVLVPQAPAIPNPSVPQVNLRVPPPAAAPVAPPQTAAILAEMATLTPEQLQLVLSTLSSVAINPIPGIPLPPSTAVALPPPHLPNPTPPPPPGPPPGSQQTWQPNPVSGYPGAFGPPGAPDGRPQPVPPYGQSPEHHGYERDSRGVGHPHGDRGRDRGRGRGRGRGRDSGDGSWSVDSGWPRKPRSDVRGGGPASPNSQRWEERWK